MIYAPESASLVSPNYYGPITVVSDRKVKKTENTAASSWKQIDATADSPVVAKLRAVARFQPIRKISRVEDWQNETLISDEARTGQVLVFVVFRGRELGPAGELTFFFNSRSGVGRRSYENIKELRSSGKIGFCSGIP
ncbi:hypothetical protein R1flu_005657 [Riccia fluitans]|uniref:Uncharacterized protein n=1 Tax=Riccia fluitans TaxID=41844 RepID=A0ABD1YUH1_9MARC